MKFLKTPSKNRSEYEISYFDGEVNCERIFTLRPGEHGVTELDIKAMHAFDDSEVYQNLKNHRPRITQEQKEAMNAWKAKFIATFTTAHGYPPHPLDVDAAVTEAFPKEWSISFDTPRKGVFQNGDPGDSSSVLATASYCMDEDEPAHIARLHELIDSMPQNWRDIYEQVVIGGMSNVEYAKEHGVTEGAVRKIAKKITNRISEAELLKKIFLRGTN